MSALPPDPGPVPRELVHKDVRRLQIPTRIMAFARVAQWVGYVVAGLFVLGIWAPYVVLGPEVFPSFVGTWPFFFLAAVFGLSVAGPVIGARLAQPVSIELGREHLVLWAGTKRERRVAWDRVRPVQGGGPGRAVLRWTAERGPSWSGRVPVRSIYADPLLDAHARAWLAQKAERARLLGLLPVTAEGGAALDVSQPPFDLDPQAGLEGLSVRFATRNTAKARNDLIAVGVGLLVWTVLVGFVAQAIVPSDIGWAGWVVLPPAAAVWLVGAAAMALVGWRSRRRGRAGRYALRASQLVIREGEASEQRVYWKQVFSVEWTDEGSPRITWTTDGKQAAFATERTPTESFTVDASVPEAARAWVGEAIEHARLKAESRDREAAFEEAIRGEQAGRGLQAIEKLRGPR